MISVNSFLNLLQRKRQYRLLSAIIFVGYLAKGKDIKSVKFFERLGVWQFKIGDQYFFSSGPGWAYDYDFLMKQFLETPGFHYRPRKGDYVVDVGAGVGEEIMVLSDMVGETGRVFSIEAHPKTFEALQLNCEMNNRKNVTLLNVAIADVPGHIFIEGHRNALGNRVNNEMVDGAARVEAITIEQLVERYHIPRISLLKVNIEGAEQLLIKGIGKAISVIDNMAISCHDFRYYNEGVEFFKTRDIVLKFLNDNNFEQVPRNTGIPAIDDYLLAFPRSGSK